MENIIIPARKNDAVLLKNIADVSFDKKYQKTLDIYESFFEEGCHCYFLMDGGLPVGELVLLPEESEVTIKSMAIVPAYRKKGYSRKLLEFAEDNAKTVKVAVNTTNKKAIDFYRKHGYNIVDNKDNLSFMEKSK